MPEIKNPPAFPQGNQSQYEAENGMSLRDWFAGQAVPAAYEKYGTYSNGANRVAEECYRVADAMLAARKASDD